MPRQLAWHPQRHWRFGGNRQRQQRRAVAANWLAAIFFAALVSNM